MHPATDFVIFSRQNNKTESSNNTATRGGKELASYFVRVFLSQCYTLHLLDATNKATSDEWCWLVQAASAKKLSYALLLFLRKPSNKRYVT